MDNQGTRPGFGLLIHHTDGAREYATGNRRWDGSTKL